MAPILKTSLALLTLSGAVSEALAKKSGHGKHMKMVKRTLFEDLGKRDSLAPYGYDRCGVARKKPYVRRPGASPVPSSKWKPCPGGAVATSSGGSPALAAAPTPAAGSAGGDSGSMSGSSADSSSSDDAEDDGGHYTMTSSGKLVKIHDDYQTASSISWSSSSDAAATPTDTWDRAQFAPTESSSWEAQADSASATSTDYTTSYVDVTSYTTTYPQAAASPSSSSESWSSSSSSSAPAWQAPQVKIKAGYGGNNDASGSSSSSSEWVAPSSQWTAPSSTSSSEVAAPTPNNVGRSYGVMGLAWDWQNPKGVLHNWCNGSKQKIYTWSAYPPSDALCDNMEWYPQYWGPAKQAEFEANVASGIIKPGMTILGYNEPDQAGQANLGIQDGINSYKNQITKYASQGFRLATPGCTSDDNGFNWLSGFIAGCAGQCGFSAIQTHYYGTDANAFIAYITKIHNAWPEYPIIVSEYAAETFGAGPDLTADQSSAYMATTQNWLKAQSFIDSYFFFGPLTSKAANGVNQNNLLINDDGSVKSIGWQYLGDA